MSIGLKRGTVKLVSHNPRWKELYEKEAKSLKGLLRDSLVDIQHVGSTAILSIPAKPIIDIALAVKSLDDLSVFKEILEKAGYTYRGKQGLEDRGLFVKGTEENRTHYVHVTEKGSKTWNDEVLFRDYLNKHTEAAKQYSDLKQSLAEKHSNDRKVYTASKAEFIENVVNRAILDFAVDVAQEAGKILMNYFGKELTKTTKYNDTDYATEADYDSEKFILGRVKEQFSKDSIVAEESGKHDQKNSQCTWMIDPLDGTKNFTTGVKDFGVLICRMNGQYPEVAVAYNPAKELLAVATAGGGTFLNGEKITLSSYQGKPVAANKEVDSLLEPLGERHRTYSAIGNTLNTLRGKYQAYVATAGFVWDFAVPALLVSEAGWKVTDRKGERYAWDGKVEFGWPGLIAAPEELHTKVISLLKARL